ncbi:MAG: DUF4388 domain-containing protein, partial [Myxococcales bacterium]|nr:DUF4388 domain-containing protein [Myxococcales bacterium]
VVFMTSVDGTPFRQSKALELGAEDLLTKPLQVEPTVSKVRRAVARVQKEASLSWGQESGVAGDLLNMSLVDIVQSLEVAVKSAEVEVVYDDGRTGRVFVRDGMLYRCEPDRPSAQETFFRLARPGSGRFRLRYGDVSHKARNLSSPTTYLLMEAMRRFDELLDPKGGGDPLRDMVSDLELPALSKREEGPRSELQTPPLEVGHDHRRVTSGDLSGPQQTLDDAPISRGLGEVSDRRAPYPLPIGIEEDAHPRLWEKVRVVAVVVNHRDLARPEQNGAPERIDTHQIDEDLNDDRIEP